MSELGHRVKYALDESRILITGSQFLIGFEFRAMLEKGIEARTVVRAARRAASRAFSKNSLVPGGLWFGLPLARRPGKASTVKE